MPTLAHLSDVHLAPLAAADSWTDYLNKRFFGYLSWRYRRAAINLREIADAIVADIKAHRPDHVAFTGDLVNLSLPREFAGAARWLSEFGKPDWISFVPGNHDAYVDTPWETGMGLLADYVTGDMRMPGRRQAGGIAAPFPFVRQRRNLAIVGLSSARPQAYHRASGTLGAVQLESLAEILIKLGERGYYRAVLIHHPPLPGQAPSHKALTDAKALRDVLQSHGAELVLHGHMHRPMRAEIAGRAGRIHVLGAPSASERPRPDHPGAAWNLFDIKRQDGVWQTSVTVRAWHHETRAMTTESIVSLA